MFRMAAIAAHPQEPVLKPPDFQVILELLRDMPRNALPWSARWALS
jgi:hypothetical protein